jgi:hypothetical protein
MFVALKNTEELRRLYDSDMPVLAYGFKRRTVEDWTSEQRPLHAGLGPCCRNGAPCM